MRRIHAFAAFSMAAALALGPAGSAAAAPASASDIIEVFPGPHAIAEALAVAGPGDVLNIHAGNYPEQVSVLVQEVTLQSAGDGVVTIDGTCRATTTLDVRAERVTIRGLRVIGAGGGSFPIAIDFSEVDAGRVLSSTVEDTCSDAWYGINVYAGGSIRILNNLASGFEDAGIYVGDITSTPFGPMVIRGNESFGNKRGVIVQDSFGAEIQVIANDIHDNRTTGIWVNVTDGVRVDRNLVVDNVDSGIEVDSNSDNNLIRGNRADGHTYDLYNGGGTGNCWIGNQYTTSFGEITC
jgi:parallel beta-helix repeat protein